MFFSAAAAGGYPRVGDGNAYIQVFGRGASTMLFSWTGVT